MNDQEIIKAAIEKAFGKESEPFYNDDPYELGWTYSVNGELRGGSEFDIIFSHDFAKAFWGKETFLVHLQQMVIFKNPTEYLWTFL
jgi:hypothetical protein